MRMTQAQIQSTPDGAILFDAGAAAQATFAPEFFDAARWQGNNGDDAVSGGRGGARFIDAPFGRCVLRHYRRGGMVARVLGDRYLWNGAERTRSFAEFRLLAELAGRGLDVPAPVAARYRRHGAHYRADLITRWIGGATTLAERVRAGTADANDAARVGAGIAAFHLAGAYHADLNAHNILLDPHKVWLLDFDRGGLRAPARSWQYANLARLRRSLLKLGAARDGEQRFDAAFWGPLMAAYERGRGQATPVAAGGARG